MGLQPGCVLEAGTQAASLCGSGREGACVCTLSPLVPTQGCSQPAGFLLSVESHLAQA